MISKHIFKKSFIFVFIIFLSIPFYVNANIICNDGTESPTCQDCHRGCCSGHDGCTDNPNHYNSENSSSNYNNNIQYNNIYHEEEKHEMKDRKVKEFYLESSIIVSVGTLFIYLCALLIKKGSEPK